MLLCPSTMCLDYENLKQEIKDLEDAGIDIFHNDIMDGCFVPNITLGMYDLKLIRKYTDKPIDVHLMIKDPSEKVDWFIKEGVDIIYIHPEAGNNILKTLCHIKESGIKCGIAINPETSVESIEYLLDTCDYVMVMSVHPGFAGQKFVEEVMDKIKLLGQLKKKHNFVLTLDGACSPLKIKECSALGVDGFVLGTSALFGKDRPYKDIINELRTLSNEQ